MALLKFTSGYIFHTSISLARSTIIMAYPVVSFPNLAKVGISTRNANVWFLVLAARPCGLRPFNRPQWFGHSLALIAVEHSHNICMIPSDQLGLRRIYGAMEAAILTEHQAIFHATKNHSIVAIHSPPVTRVHME